MIKQTFLLCLTFLICSAIVIGCQKPTSPLIQNTLTINQTKKIGVITPLTGPGSEYGTMTQKGIELARNALNQVGGLDNRSLIELIYEDSQCNPKIALNAYHKLITQDGVDTIIGTVCSSVTLTLGPLAEQDKILLISSASSNPEITNLGEYIFRDFPSDALQGKVLSDFVKQNFPTHKIGLIFINNAYGSGIKDAFTQNFAQDISLESFAEGATDFQTQITKLKNAGVNLVIIPSYAVEAGRFLKQSKEVGFRPIFIGSEGTSDPKIITIAGPSAENFIATQPFTPPNNIHSQFMTKFKQTIMDWGI